MQSIHSADRSFLSFLFLRNIQLALCHYAITGNRREQFSKNPHEIIFDKRIKRLLDWIGAAAGWKRVIHKQYQTMDIAWAGGRETFLAKALVWSYFPIHVPCNRPSLQRAHARQLANAKPM